MSIKHVCLNAFLALLVTGCACSDSKPTASNDRNRNSEIAAAPIPLEDDHAPVTHAAAILNPIKSNKVHGTVMFTKVENGIKVVADINGLTPGKHGFHIHEHGDCGGDEAAAAGAHFNPTSKDHGGPDNPIRHTGDLGNLIADGEGHAYYERIDKTIALEGENSIIGRSVIIHADADDLTTQPAGASGAKISCGVIQVVGSEE